MFRMSAVKAAMMLSLCAAVWAAGTFSAALRAQGERSVWDGVYTEAQAARGAELYDKYCAECHGAGGVGGGMAPALTGLAFTANYDGLTMGDVFDRNQKTMPPGKEGQMSAQQVADITAAILKFNDFPAGPDELPGQSMALRAIKFLAQKP